MDAKGLFQKQKPTLYVGYDHLTDAPYYEGFKRMFSSLYAIERDNSLERELDSDDAEGCIRNLRDGAMAGCACAVILCGARTHLSKFVDWEIKAALDRKRAVVGILLPTLPDIPGVTPLLPDRLRANFDGGFAILCRWHELSSTKIDLSARVRYAMEQPARLIENSAPPRSGNG